MSILGKIVRTAVNVATLPVAVAKDVVTLGGIAEDRRESHTEEALQRLKDEAGD